MLKTRCNIYTKIHIKIGINSFSAEILIMETSRQACAWNVGITLYTKLWRDSEYLLIPPANFQALCS